MFMNFKIWDMQHAQSFYKIINDVCDDSLINSHLAISFGPHQPILAGFVSGWL